MEQQQLPIAKQFDAKEYKNGITLLVPGFTYEEVNKYGENIEIYICQIHLEILQMNQT